MDSQDFAKYFALHSRVMSFMQEMQRQQHPLISILRELRSLRASTFLIGGAVRDLHLYSAEATPRDIDLVVSADELLLREVLHRCRAKIPIAQVQRNRFGGYKFSAGIASFDIWSLANTWAIREQLIPEASPIGLLSSTFLNAEAALVEINLQTMEPGCIWLSDFYTGLHEPLAMNLVENKNTRRALFSALCTAVLHDLPIGRALAEHMAANLKASDVSEIAEFGRYKGICLQSNKLWRYWIWQVKQYSDKTSGESIRLTIPHASRIADPVDRLGLKRLEELRRINLRTAKPLMSAAPILAAGRRPPKSSSRGGGGDKSMKLGARRDVPKGARMV